MMKSAGSVFKTSDLIFSNGATLMSLMIESGFLLPVLGKALGNKTCITFATAAQADKRMMYQERITLHIGRRTLLRNELP